MGEKRLTISLSPELEGWLAEKARSEERSLAAQLRIIIRRAKETEEWGATLGANREAQEA